MIAYWALFSIFAISALIPRANEGRTLSNFPVGVAVLLLTLFVGLRWEVGPDWPSYHWIFERLRFSGLGTALRQSDPGYYLIVFFVRSVGGEFFIVNLICAFFFSYGLAKFCSTLPAPWLGLLVAVPYLVVVIAMSAVRQGVALGFIFLALRDLGSKPLWKSVMWVLVGSLFHASAFIVAVLIAVSYQRNRLYAVFAILVSAIPAYYVLFGTFDQYFTRYGSQKIQSGGVAFRVAMNAIPAAIYLLRGRRQFVPPAENPFWRNMALLSLILIPTMIFIESTAAIDRLSLYAIPLQIVVLSAIPTQFAENAKGRLFPVALVIAYCATTFWVYFTFGTHARYYIPYKITDFG